MRIGDVEVGQEYSFDSSYGKVFEASDNLVKVKAIEIVVQQVTNWNQKTHNERRVLVEQEDGEQRTVMAQQLGEPWKEYAERRAERRRKRAEHEAYRARIESAFEQVGIPVLRFQLFYGEVHVICTREGIQQWLDGIEADQALGDKPIKEKSDA